MRNTKHGKTNYKMIMPFLAVVDATEDGHCQFEVSNYMPLSIERLGNDNNGNKVYGMMHYTMQNGDLMRDPDMTFFINSDAGTVEPLTFQNDFMGMYQEVYCNDGKSYRPQLRTSLDNFLWQWLKNLEAQGFAKLDGLI